MPHRAAAFHREQQHPWSCVAACVAIVHAWLRAEPTLDEAALLACWTSPKTSIAHTAAIGALRCWDPTDPRNLDRLRSALLDSWLIVTLFPGPLTHFTQQRRPAPVSPHGRLVPYDEPRRAPGLPHAVVLVEVIEPDGVLYLDPYYPARGQPFALRDDELMEAWTGHVTIPVRPVEASR